MPKEELEAKEFERRKKQAADLGMKPGTPEYVHYVANGKAIDIPNGRQFTSHQRHRR